MSFARTSPWWLKSAAFMFVETRHFFIAQTERTDDQTKIFANAHAFTAILVCCTLMPSLIVGVRSRVQTNMFICESFMYISFMCLLITFYLHVFLDYAHMVCCVLFCWVHFLFCAWHIMSSTPHVVLGGALLRLAMFLSLIPTVFYFAAFTERLEIFNFSFLCIIFAGEIVGNVSAVVNQMALHLIKIIIYFVC